MKLDDDVTLEDFIEANKDLDHLKSHFSVIYDSIRHVGAHIPNFIEYTLRANEYKIKKQFTDKLDSIIQE
jgi:hypothetical protein